MGATHIHNRTVHTPVRVRDGTTLEVVPLQTQTGGMMARTRTRAVPVGAHVCVHLSCVTDLFPVKS